MEVAYDADLVNSALAAIRLVCTTIHLRLPHPITTAVVNNHMCKYVHAFIARNQFRVGCFPFGLPFEGYELIRRRERCIRINHRVSLMILTWRQLIRRLLKNVFRRHKMPSGREVLSRLFGWLKSHLECAERKKQMVRMLNSE